jgi:hypothetical protein
MSWEVARPKRAEARKPPLRRHRPPRIGPWPAQGGNLRRGRNRQAPGLRRQWRRGPDGLPALALRPRLHEARRRWSDDQAQQRLHIREGLRHPKHRANEHQSRKTASPRIRNPAAPKHRRKLRVAPSLKSPGRRHVPRIRVEIGAGQATVRGLRELFRRLERRAILVGNRRVASGAQGQETKGKEQTPQIAKTTFVASPYFSHGYTMSAFSAVDYTAGLRWSSACMTKPILRSLASRFVAFTPRNHAGSLR